MTAAQRSGVQLTDGAPGAGTDGRLPQSIARSLLAAGGARLIVLPVTGMSSLLIARLVTDAAGVERFGEIMLIATLTQLLIFADLGVGAAVATESARLADGGDPARFRRTVLTALRTTLACSAVLIIGAVAVGVAGLWPRLLGLDGGGARPAGSANLATVLALTAFATSLPFALGEPVLRGAGHLHRAVLLVGLSTPLALILTVVLRLGHAPPFAYALSLPLGFLFGALLSAAGALRSVAGALARLGREVLLPRRYPGLPVAATAVPMFVVMVGLPLALQSDRIVISLQLDPRTLSDYSYAAQLYTPLWSVVSVAAAGLWPIFATGAPGTPGLRQGWLMSLRLLGAGGVVIAAAYLLFSGPVIGFMSGGTSFPPLSLLASFAALLVVQALHVGTGMLLIAPRQLRFQAGCVCALVITNIPLSWLLAPRLGASGPVVASVVTVTACQLIPALIAGRRWTAIPGRR